MNQFNNWISPSRQIARIPELSVWLTNIFNQQVYPGIYLKVDDKFISLCLKELNLRVSFETKRIDFSDTKNIYPSIINPPAVVPGSKESLCLLSNQRSTHLIIQQTKETFYINYDLPSLIIWLLSRKEELSSSVDQHNRFLESECHAVVHGYSSIPILDQWFSYIRRLLFKQYPSLPRHISKFRWSISQDVDRPFRYFNQSCLSQVRHLAADFLSCDLGSALGFLLTKMPSRQNYTYDPYNTFNWLSDTLLSRGLTCTFNFAAINHSHHSLDPLYSLDNPWIEHIIKVLVAYKFTIGLHLSYRCLDKPSLIEREANCLLDKLHALGCHPTSTTLSNRFHYLRIRHPRLLRYMRLAGISIDTSFGYNNRFGFRCGAGFQFEAIDPRDLKPLGITISPLIAMESAIVPSKSIPKQEISSYVGKFDEMLQACKANQSEFTLLWHNSELRHKSHRQVLLSILDKLKQ